MKKIFTSKKLRKTITTLITILLPIFLQIASLAQNHFANKSAQGIDLLQVNNIYIYYVVSEEPREAIESNTVEPSSEIANANNDVREQPE